MIVVALTKWNTGVTIPLSVDLLTIALNSFSIRLIPTACRNRPKMNDLGWFQTREAHQTIVMQYPIVIVVSTFDLTNHSETEGVNNDPQYPHHVLIPLFVSEYRLFDTANLNIVSFTQPFINAI